MSIKDALSNTKAYDAFMKMHRLQEIRIFLGERRRFCKEAREQFALENPKHGSYNDYRKIYNDHMKCCKVDAKNIRIDKRSDEFTNVVFGIRSIFCIRILRLTSTLTAVRVQRTFRPIS